MYLIGFLALLVACSTKAYSPEGWTVNAIAKRISKPVQSQIDSGKNVGAIIGIYVKGETRYLSFGSIKKGSEEKPNQKTLFEIGSITKPITGLMLAQAIEDGILRDDDQLNSFRNDWKHQKTSDITLVELVTHTSGLPTYPCNLKDEPFSYYKYNEQELIEGLKDDAFTEKCNLGPKNTWLYSNWGFGLLGYLITIKQNTNFAQILESKWTAPLDMQNTITSLEPRHKALMAQGYTYEGKEAPLADRDILQGSGSIRSNAEDMMKFALAYLYPEKTSLESVLKRSMQVKFIDTDGSKVAYGWEVTKANNLYKNGMTMGYSRFIKIYPKDETVIFYLSNTERDLKCVISAAEEIDCDPFANNY